MYDHKVQVSFEGSESILSACPKAWPKKWGTHIEHTIKNMNWEHVGGRKP